MKDGGPAFPVTIKVDEESTAYHYGMTLRDWFAGQAMIGIMLRGSESGEYNIFRAQMAYKQADAMLAERGSEK